jgi:hypothetical protein
VQTPDAYLRWVVAIKEKMRLGSAQVLGKAQFGQENRRKSKPYSFDFLCPGLAKFGVGLEKLK